MTDIELKERVDEVSRDKYYRRKPRETREEYASRVAGIIHRGWAFLGVNKRPWFEEQKLRILALIP